MDIRNFFLGSAGTSSSTGLQNKRASNCVEKESSSESNKRKCEYEKHRKRLVLDEWKKEYTWLGCSEDRTEMWCTVCRNFPNIADGSSSYFKVPGVVGDAIRITSLRAHNKTKKHILCMQAKLTLDNPKGAPLNKCLSNLSEEQRKKMTILFNTAYFCAKEELAFTKFEKLCKLQIKNGIVCGANYLNDKGGHMFVHHIAQVLRGQLTEELEKVRFFCVLADGSSDCSTIEEDIVYVRYVSSGNPVTKFVNLVELEHADAPGVLSSLVQSLDEVHLNEDTRLEKLVGINLDGASVNMGRYAGVAALLKKDIPHIVAIHCIAHNLELAVMDAIKTKYIKGVFETTVKGVIKFYSRSPKQRRQLTAISNFLEAASIQMGSISQIRWLSSQQRALVALQKNLVMIDMHLENVAAEKDNTKSAKAKGYLKEIHSVRFVRTLHYWLDILEILAAVSKKFQADEFTLLDISSALENACLQLESLKHTTGRYLKSFEDAFDGSFFQGIKLSGKINDEPLGDLINDVMDSIVSRFEMLQKKPLSHFQVFNFHLWPINSLQSLSTYGNEEIAQLCEHFSAVLEEEEIRLAQLEWSTFKLTVRSMSTTASTCPFTVYAYLLKAKPKDMTNILLLVEIMFCFSPSTSACERGFSCMNRVKTSLRSRLLTATMNDLMRISIDGPDSCNYDPSLAIEHWQSAAKGTRHIRGHSLQLYHDEECEEIL